MELIVTAYNWASNPTYSLLNRPHVGSPKDHINIMILQTMISGIPLILDLGTRTWDLYVYVVF